MKRKILSFMLAFVCVITCGIALTGCGKNMDRCTAVVPTDQEYTATLIHHLETTNVNYDHAWSVVEE